MHYWVLKPLSFHIVTHLSPYCSVRCNTRWALSLWLPNNHFIPTDVTYPNSFQFPLKCKLPCPALPCLEKYFPPSHFHILGRNLSCFQSSVPSSSVSPHIHFCYSTFSHIFLISTQLLLTFLPPLSLQFLPKELEKTLSILVCEGGDKCPCCWGAESQQSFPELPQRPASPTWKQLSFSRSNCVLITRISASSILPLCSVFQPIFTMVL